MEPWPPPDPDAVPDAAIVPTGSGIRALAALKDLDALGIDVVLDATDEVPPPEACGRICSVLYRDPSVERIQVTESSLAEIERTHGLARGQIAIELLITAPRSFLEIDELAAASGRIVSLITDPAMLPEAFGVEGSTEIDQFAYPRGRLILAAAHRRMYSVGLFGAAGHHRIAAAGRDAAQFSFSIGLHGGLCRTWDDVRACNRGFTPDDGRVTRARRIIEAMEEAGRQGLGAISLDGRMIDLPFIRSSESTLRLAKHAAARAQQVGRMFARQG
jgi:citrate lyase beta subunit